MKTIPVKKVKIILHNLGLRQAKGNGTGHDIWMDSIGQQVHPVLRHKDMPYFSLYCLGKELEVKKICERQSFINAVKLA